MITLDLSYVEDGLRLWFFGTALVVAAVSWLLGRFCKKITAFKGIASILVGLLWAKFLVVPLTAEGFLDFLPKGGVVQMVLCGGWAAVFCLLGHIWGIYFYGK